jgi:tRNA uridine 5-carbamoylmethylation protein Kti12
MKTCVVLSAIPGSGKSTWARKFRTEHPNTFIVSSDDIRLELYGSVTCFDHEAFVWQTFLKRLNDYCDAYDDVFVIADATNLQNKFRIFYCENTPRFDRHMLVLFNVPYEQCLLQNTMRSPDRIVPTSAMEMMRKEYEEPNEKVKEIYDEIITVNTFNPDKK